MNEPVAFPSLESGGEMCLPYARLRPVRPVAWASASSRGQIPEGISR